MIVGRILGDLLLLYLYVLVFRLVMEYVVQFARSFRPSGFLLVLVETAYTLTDPPLRLLRRVIPPLRLGSVALDLSFLVLFFAIYVLIAVVGSL